MAEKLLMKGNDAVAVAAMRCGCDGYFGYPITPQSEILETLTEADPQSDTGMVVLQAESEVAAINMIYGGAACGKKVFTSSSGPGISLMSEGLSYLAGAELPCLIVNVMRGGPGLGTIQPGQADYFQSTKGGGHGDYNLIVLAPDSVQEMYDFVDLGFELAFKYRNPVLILTDGIIGQMMEKVELGPVKPRLTDEEIIQKYGSWATTGKPANRERNIVTSLDLDANRQERFNLKLQRKYDEIRANEVRCEKISCDDAEYVIIAYGLSARVGKKTVESARNKGIKVGILRPITLFPYPYDEIKKMSPRLKGILTVEMSAGQMLEDVRSAVEGKVPVHFYGRLGGMLPEPEDVLAALEDLVANEIGRTELPGLRRSY